jgi:hypothetical protein
MTATPTRSLRSGDRESSRRVGSAAVENGIYALLPGVLVVYFAFNGGGYFPDAPAFVALVLNVVVVVRICTARNLVAGRAFLIVAGLLACFTAWILLSSFWTSSAARPLIEFDRAWMYLLVLVTFGLAPRSQHSARWMVRSLTAGAFVVAAAGLTTRLLPDTWPVKPGVLATRLSYPTSYWNTLGLLAAIGCLLAIGLAAAERESRLGRVVASASVPLFVTTLYFTFSRGAIGAFLIGLLAYLIVSRQRALLGAALAVAGPAVFAVMAAYGADALAARDVTAPAAISEGRDLAVTVGLCMLTAAALRWLAWPIDRRMQAVRLSVKTRRVLLGAAAATVLAGLLVATGLGAVGWTGRQVDRFAGQSSPVVTSGASDARRRLTDVSSNGRIGYWKVAFSVFADDRLKGRGAGTYKFAWDETNRQYGQVRDAHSLYLETLAELGLVGLILVAGAIVGVLAALWVAMRGPNRGLYAALFAAGVAWAVRAGADWDWEMPAVSVFFFAAGGLALAGRRPRRRAAETTTRELPIRVGLAVGLLVAAIAPALIMVSQARMNRAATAFEARDCHQVRASAISSLRAIAKRPEPYQLLAYCDIASVAAPQAVRAMEEAVAVEPDSWEYRYSLALARASNGEDPRQALNEASHRAPQEPLVRNARGAFAGKTSAGEWQEAARPLVAETLMSGRLTLR